MDLPLLYASSDLNSKIVFNNILIIVAKTLVFVQEYNCMTHVYTTLNVISGCTAMNREDAFLKRVRAPSALRM